MKFLIDKFLNNTITASELEELKTYLHDPKNHLKFKTYLNDLRDVNIALDDQDWKLAYNSVIDRIQKTKPEKHFSFGRMKYAAIIILCLGIGYLYQKQHVTENSKLVIANENITLELENGTIQILNEGGISKVTNTKGEIIGNQKGSQITYVKSATEAEETLVYNTLTIPYGKRFKIQLSDSTVVHLNSGTTLKYPVKFIAGQKRNVFLDGEAFFVVAKDEKHPFTVHADAVNIRVLGTQFNVSSYFEDEYINTVLAEGSVSVYDSENLYNGATATSLTPGYGAIWKKNDKTIVVEEAEVEMSTAWIKGKVVFRYMTFENIIRKLERHYNVVIINNNESLSKERFAASFDIETIEEVLESFKKNYQINYTIKNNVILIN